MPKIKMICDTNYNGFKKYQEEYDVDEMTHDYLVNGKLAESLEIPDNDTPISYEEMEPKALYKLCRQRNIELEDDKKKQKEYLISKLMEYDTAE